MEDLEAAPAAGERPVERGGMAQLSRGANLFFPASPARAQLALQHMEGGKEGRNGRKRTLKGHILGDGGGGEGAMP